MKITIEPTDKIVELDGVPARVWEGITENGVPCHLFVTRIGVAKNENAEEFERDLQEQRAPRPMTPEIQAIPLKMIL